MSTSLSARCVIGSSRSAAKVSSQTIRTFTSTPPTSARDTTPALPGGRLPASSLRTLIALHHLSHPLRQITIAPSDASKSTSTGDSSNLMPIVKHTLRKSSLAQSSDDALRRMATARLVAQGIAGKMGDRLTVLGVEGADQPRRTGTSQFDKSTSREPEGMGYLYHDHSRNPTTAQVININRSPPIIWSDGNGISTGSSNSPSSSGPRSQGPKAANNVASINAGTRSILADRETRLKEALYGISSGGIDITGGDGGNVGNMPAVPGLEVVLEMVEKEGRGSA